MARLHQPRVAPQPLVAGLGEPRPRLTKPSNKGLGGDPRLMQPRHDIAPPQPTFHYSTAADSHYSRALPLLHYSRAAPKAHNQTLLITHILNMVLFETFESSQPKVDRS